MGVRLSLRPLPVLSWVSFRCFPKVVKQMVIIASAVVIVQIFSEYLMMPSDGIYFEKDPNICKKRYAWKQPLMGLEPDWYPFLTSQDLLWSNSYDKPSKIDTVLQQLYLPFGLKGAGRVAFDTLQWIPHQEIPKSVSSLRCKTCIVVGNGNNLLGCRLGKFIDSHHVIIRINDAPLKGYENDVGKKTTFRLFFPESALPDPLENSDNDTVFVLVPFKIMDLLWVQEVLQNNEEEEEKRTARNAEPKPPTKILMGFWRPPPMEWKGRASHLRIMNPYVTFEATYRFLHLDKESQRHSTTGIIAVNFALHLCQEVNIVGFGYPPENDRIFPVHYYGTDPLEKDMDLTHDIAAEREWLLNVQKRGIISNVLCPS